jgi:flagellar assembly protein FliH
MSSRIIRGDDRVSGMKVSAPHEDGAPAVFPQDHIMTIEKQAFEQGYREGERAGKEMGGKMVDAAVKRYDDGVREIAECQRALAEAMERQTAQLALEIAKKIVRREMSVDTDLISALVNVAIKRVQDHHSIVVRVSPADFDRVRSFVAAVNPAVTVKDDATLERGGFLLDTAQTHLDGRISTQIETIQRALFHE